LSDFTVDDPNAKMTKFPIYEDYELQNVKKILNDLVKIDSNLKYAAFNGYVKGTFHDPLPFIYDWKLHKKIFLQMSLGSRLTQRDIFNNYLTGFFNAYLDCQFHYESGKQYSTTYWPGFNIYNENVERFFTIYPDGIILHMIRSPLSWAGSAKKRQPHKFGRKYMDSLWLRSTQNAISFRKAYPKSFIIIDFDDLVRNTKSTMRNLCTNIGLNYNSSMELPTFNSMPILANSIHKEMQQEGIVKDVEFSWKRVLNKEEVSEIVGAYNEVYDKAKLMALSAEMGALD